MSTQSFLQEQSDYDDDNDDDKIEDECNAFVDVVNRIFEVSEDSSIYGITSNLVLDDENSYMNVEIGNKRANLACAKIQYLYDDKTILIHDISKCGNAETKQGSGTDIIKRLIAVGYEFKKYFSEQEDVRLQLIIDSDQSKINVGGIAFELNWLYLFSTGETWYNHLGFKEKDYDEIKKCVDPFISAEIKRKFKKIMHNIKEISNRASINAHTLTKLHHYHAELEDAKQLLSHLLSHLPNHERCIIRNKFSDISYDLYEVKGGNNKRTRTMRRTRKQKNKKTNKTNKTNKKKKKTQRA
jgi:hypothetical protein